MKKWSVSLMSLFALFALFATAAQAEPVRDKHVTAELLAEHTSFQPGQPFTVAVRLVMDPHWHTYWRNGGDAGLGTTVDWDLPPGFSAGPLQWPHPARIPSGPLMSYGFENEVLLLTEITPPPAFEGAARLRARVGWLMCEEACIPGKADLTLALPARDVPPEPDPATTAAFAATRAAWPAKDAAWSASGRIEGSTVVVRLEPREGARGGSPDAYFFPYSDQLIEHAAPQVIQPVAGGYELRVPRSALAADEPPPVSGAIVWAEGWRENGSVPALEVDAAPAASSASTVPAPAKRPMRLAAALLFAFVGGLILNLMPCVFPVLSLKVMGFVEQAGESRGRLLAHGLAFTAGVLACFWTLAITLMALRAGGAGIGWGFQLQDPRIVTALAALFFLLGLNLFGVFEMGLSLTGTGTGLQHRPGLGGSFFSGLLATIVATPCTAPFMGAALGWALTQPPAAALGIFTALGLGMASPYVVLSSSPALLRRVPRPGAWMESMKQFMGFLMMATVVWMLWVLGQQTGVDGLARVLAALLLLGLGAWIAGRWGALHRPPRTRFIAHALGLLIVLAALLGTLRSLTSVGPETGAQTTKGGVTWEPFSPERLAELRAAGQPVFIDFTAAWCLTCQVNKRVALHQRDVEQAFRDRGIVTLKADWTDRNAMIEKALAGYGRSGVPLYVLYNRGPQPAPTLLPEVLTAGVVLDALKAVEPQP